MLAYLDKLFMPMEELSSMDRILGLGLMNRATVFQTKIARYRTVISSFAPPLVSDLHLDVSDPIHAYDRDLEK